MHEAASSPILGYHPAGALSRLVREEQRLHSPTEILRPVKPALISSGPGFYVTCSVNVKKRKDSTPLSHSHFFSVSVGPALFIVTTPGFGREHTYRCTHALSPGHSVFSSLAGYPQTCEDLRSQPQSQQRGGCRGISFCNGCRGTGRDGDTAAPPRAKGPHRPTARPLKKLLSVSKITLRNDIASPF